VRRKRNRFQVWPAVPPKGRLPVPITESLLPEADVARVAEWFRQRDPDGSLTAECIRDSLDIVLDGQRTGRWCYGHLTKTEKTHLGTVIEIELQKEFGISDEGPLDYAIAGVPVDCKFSAEFGNWQIPREMYRRREGDELIGDDFIALLVWAEEKSREWRAGLIRIRESRLREGRNQDKKRTLLPEAIGEIHWIWRSGTLLPENTLLDLADGDRNAIFSFPRSGQQRINELFRRVQLRTVRRTTVLTVAQQDDALKRPRDARKHLRPEGIVILGHEKAHRQISHELGLHQLATVTALPEKGEFIAATLVEASWDAPSPKALINGRYWRLAKHGDQVGHAPLLPRSSERE
jgi:Restriction endonuclease NaeI